MLVILLTTLLPVIITMIGWLLVPIWRERLIIDSAVAKNQLYVDELVQTIEENMCWSFQKSLQGFRFLPEKLIIGRNLLFVAWLETCQTPHHGSAPNTKVWLWTRNTSWLPILEKPQAVKECVSVFVKTSVYQADTSLTEMSVNVLSNIPYDSQLLLVGKLHQETQRSSNGTLCVVVWGSTGTGKTEFFQTYYPQTCQGFVVRWNPGQTGSPSYWDVKELIKYQKRRLGKKYGIIVIDEADGLLHSITGKVKEIPMTNKWISPPVFNKTGWTEAIDCFLREDNVIVAVIMNSDPRTIDKIDPALLGEKRFRLRMKMVHEIPRDDFAREMMELSSFSQSQSQLC